MKKLLFILLLLFSFVACEKHVASCDSVESDSISEVVVDTLN